MSVLVRREDGYSITAEYFENAMSVDLFALHDDGSEIHLGVLDRNPDDLLTYSIEGRESDEKIGNIHAIADFLISENPWIGI